MFQMIVQLIRLDKDNLSKDKKFQTDLALCGKSNHTTFIYPNNKLNVGISQLIEVSSNSLCGW